MKNTVKTLTKSPLSVASWNEQAKVLAILNPKREALSPAILKSFSGYQHLTDAEAEEKCTSIRSFARLFGHVGLHFAPLWASGELIAFRCAHVVTFPFRR